MSGLAAIAAAAGALVLPGLALELLLVPRSPGPLVRGVRAFLLSLAFWPLAVFATRLPGISLGRLAWAGVLGSGATAVAVAAARRRATRPGGALAWALLAAFAALTALHLAPVRAWIVAPGSDMSAHTLLARLVLEADALPATYGPIYPFMAVGPYATGLPATAAVLSRLSGLAAHRTALALALLAYPALAGGLFLVARRFASDAPALAAAWVVAAGCDVYAVLEWGGNPTVLSLALALAAAAPAAAARAGALRDDGALASPVLLAGAALVHVIPVIGLAYALPPAALGWAAQRPGSERRRLLLAWSALALAAAVLGGLPYLLGPPPVVSQAELAWTMEWQRGTGHAYRGTWTDFPWTIWPYLHARLGTAAFGVGGVGIAAALAARERRHLPWLAFGGATLLLVLNSRYWVLPGSAALYPERMTMLLHAPLAALLATAFASAAALAAGARGPARIGLGALAAGLLVFYPARWALGRLLTAGHAVMVGADDLRAMRWMAERLPADAVIENELGDAGPWIPALAFRTVLHPHDNPFYRDELEAWRSGVRPGWRFTGARAVYPVRITAEVARRQPERYREVFRSGEAAVFRITGP